MKTKFNIARIMKSETKRLIILVCLVVLLPMVSEAQNQEKGQSKSRTAVLNFEDELVKGQNVKPELFYLLQQKNFNYNRLIKLRKNFIPESKRSFENINSNRGSH